MKKLLLSTVAVCATLAAGAALAADLPSRKAAPVYVAPPPPPPMWTGFYIGLNAGATFGGSQNVNVGTYGMGNAPGALGLAAASAAAGTGPFSVNNTGFIGGGQAGYNYQWNQIVLGLEADMQGVAGGTSNASSATGAGVLGAPAFSVLGGVNVTKSLDYLGTVRGRVGYLVTPTILLYATGGLAYGGVTSSTSVFQSMSPAAPGITSAWGGAGAYSDTRVGWTAGAGAEWMFMPNWSAKIEYLYYNLGTVNYTGGVMGSTILATGAPAFMNAVSTTTRYDGHIVRAGLNYHFNWGASAPVVAKY